MVKSIKGNLIKIQVGLLPSFSASFYFIRRTGGDIISSMELHELGDSNGSLDPGSGTRASFDGSSSGNDAKESGRGRSQQEF